MRQPCRVHALDRPCDADAQAEVVAPVAALTFIQKALLVMRGGKPLAFFVLAFDAEHVVVGGAKLEEKLLPINRVRSGPSVGAGHGHDVRRPAIDSFPVVPADLIENIVAIFADNVLQALHRIRVLLVSLKICTT
jgi:hypothetical protein